jgi:hypothetical protein
VDHIYVCSTPGFDSLCPNLACFIPLVTDRVVELCSPIPGFMRSNLTTYRTRVYQQIETSLSIPFPGRIETSPCMRHVSSISSSGMVHGARLCKLWFSCRSHFATGRSSTPRARMPSSACACFFSVILGSIFVRIQILLMCVRSKSPLLMPSPGMNGMYRPR